MIGFIYTKIDNFPRSSVGWRAVYQSVGRGFEPCTSSTFYLFCGTLYMHFWGKCYRFWKFLNLGCNDILEYFNPCKYCKVSDTTLITALLFWGDKIIQSAPYSLHNYIFFKLKIKFRCHISHLHTKYAPSPLPKYM